MEIYVVQYGDNIKSIANKYGISLERLISDNGIINPYSLVVGQSLVILHPKKTYVVQLNDNLTNIAYDNGISEMQLIRNNPFLYDRKYIYQDEILVISYDTIKDIQVDGFTNSFVSQDVLTRALPYLTHLSIFNYHIADNSTISSYGNDIDIIQMAKQYGTIPLLMISALSTTGAINVEFVYELLLDNELQDKLIYEMLQILRSKEFLGVNLLINNISEYNQRLYLNIFAKISELLKKEGYLFMITITPDYSIHEDLDYDSISLLVDKIIFLQNVWDMKNKPPAPISNISLIRPFIEHVTSKVSPNYISLAKPLIAFDWITPFRPGSKAVLMSLSSTIVLAYDQSSVILMDDVSQTPYFDYIRSIVGAAEKHIVWFIDARSIKALNDVALEYDLVGTGLWNITSYNQQLFSITNATFNIIKLPLQ